MNIKPIGLNARQKVDKPSLVDRIKPCLSTYLRQVMDRKQSVHAIALGVAIGTFIAIIPTPGFGALLGVLAVFLLKNINKVSVFFAMAFWNYFTLAPIYVLSFKIGDALFGDAPIVSYRIELLNRVYDFSRRFLVGNVLLAVVFSIVSYFLVAYVVNVYRRSHDA